MRRLLISLAAVAAAATATHSVHAQSVMLPANADLRAMQAPADWEGSRSQQSQDADPDSSRWSAISLSNVVPHLGATAPAEVPVVAQGAPDFRVDVWDKQDHLVETMAHCATLAVGKAAFKEAAKERPGQKVTLRSDALVVASREAAK